jgi:hypothetical protein
MNVYQLNLNIQDGNSGFIIEHSYTVCITTTYKKAQEYIEIKEKQFEEIQELHKTQQDQKKILVNKAKSKGYSYKIEEWDIQLQTEWKQIKDKFDNLTELYMGNIKGAIMAIICIKEAYSDFQYSFSIDKFNLIDS